MESMGVNFPNSLKSEHLKEGVPPIFVCVGTAKDFNEDMNAVKISNLIQNPIRGLDWYKQVQRGEKRTSYVISNIDSFSKFSEKFSSCTSVVVTGIDRETGKNISFITHQSSWNSLSSGRDNFIDDLGESLWEIREKCLPDTLDAVIVGGTVGGDLTKRYMDVIKAISEEVKNTLKFEPVVVNGPKPNTDIGTESVYYDTEHRKLYLVRPEVNSNIGSFTQSSIDEIKGEFGKINPQNQ